MVVVVEVCWVDVFVFEDDFFVDFVVEYVEVVFMCDFDYVLKCFVVLDGVCWIAWVVDQ